MGDGKNQVEKTKGPYKGYEKNLRPRWKKGECPNPAGRPPSAKCIPDILRKYGDMKASPNTIRFLRSKYPTRGIKDISTRDAILMRAEYDAECGDHNARTFFAERTEGKIREFLDINSKTIGIDTTPMNLSKLTNDKISYLREIMRDVFRSPDNTPAEETKVE